MEDEIAAARQQGRLQGQIEAMEKMQVTQNSRINDLDKRMSTQEKITWGILGAIAFIQSVDMIKAVLQ